MHPSRRPRHPGPRAADRARAGRVRQLRGGGGVPEDVAAGADAHGQARRARPGRHAVRAQHPPRRDHRGRPRVRRRGRADAERPEAHGAEPERGHATSSADAITHRHLLGVRHQPAACSWCGATARRGRSIEIRIREGPAVRDRRGRAQRRRRLRHRLRQLAARHDGERPAAQGAAAACSSRTRIRSPRRSGRASGWPSCGTSRSSPRRANVPAAADRRAPRCPPASPALHRDRRAADQHPAPRLRRRRHRHPAVGRAAGSAVGRGFHAAQLAEPSLSVSVGLITLRGRYLTPAASGDGVADQGADGRSRRRQPLRDVELRRHSVPSRARARTSTASRTVRVATTRARGWSSSQLARRARCPRDRPDTSSSSRGRTGRRC